MILSIELRDSLGLPPEFKTPAFFIDDETNPFINDKSRGLGEISCQLEISQINFFIGANNSGKSRFMRGLLKENSPFTNLSNKTPYIKLSKELSIIQTRGLEKDKSSEELFSFFKKHQVNNNLIPTNYELINNYSNTKNYELISIITRLKEDFLSIEDLASASELNDFIKQAELYQKELLFSKENIISKKNYTPVLRSLLQNTDLNEYSFLNTYNKFLFNNNDAPSNININTGLDLWGVIKRMWNTPKKRDIEEFCKFLSNNFFERREVEILPNTKPVELISIAIDRGEFRGIHEIGDGIQSLILLLFPIFIAEKNEVFFIEEPEINLHPGFQRIFIETLLNNEFLQTKNLKYFFTTHSNHFLDLTLKNDKVSFFQFQKLEDGKHLIKTNIKPSKETLDELGVNTSSVLLANASIWVEGPTDRMYVSKFLQLYCERNNKPYLKEDIDYAFFEYGGNLITHYLFDEEVEFSDAEIREKINSFALSNKIFLLADNDNPKENSKKAKREKEFDQVSKSNLNFKYQNTIVKEIENLLPAKIIKEFMKQLVGNNVIDKLEGITFTMDDYKSIGLGEFCEEKFEAVGINKYNKNDSLNTMKSFKEGNTLKSDYKNKLAQFVINFKNEEGKPMTHEDIFEENKSLENIIKELHNFIKPQGISDVQHPNI